MKLNRSTKTDDAKSKNAVNRLDFMKLKSWKSWKKNFSFEKESFFENARSTSRLACSDRSKREISYLIWLADVNVIEDDVNVIENDVNLIIWVSVYQNPKYIWSRNSTFELMNEKFFKRNWSSTTKDVSTFSRWKIWSDI
jgi:hypothetical protein